MTVQNLIETAKVEIVDNGRRSRSSGESIKTIIVKLSTGYISEWHWALERDCGEDGLAYQVKIAAEYEYSQMHKNCTKEPCPQCLNRIKENISNKNFAYARFKYSSYGNYYNLYHTDPDSPTGVSMVGSCNEKTWEEISSYLGKQNQYLSSEEKA